MLTKDEVERIITQLKNSQSCYVSEAHIQLQFAIIGAKLFEGKYEFVPEYPGYTMYGDEEAKKTEFDLLVHDLKKNQNTLIEFKYKTKNLATKQNRVKFPVYLGGELPLANDGAQNLNRYDCWRDIYRIEQNVKNSKNPASSQQVKIENGFFIFITNDDLYKKDDGEPSFCDGNKVGMFSLKGEFHKCQLKTVNKSVSESSAGKFRKSHSIDIKNDYYFTYEEFQTFKVEKYNKFWYLLVEIDK